MSADINELTPICKLVLMEKCQGITRAYECRKQVDSEITRKCLETLHNLCTLLSEIENHTQDSVQRSYALHYLSNYKDLTSQLVHIVSDAEDIRLRFSALEILYVLLSNTEIGFDEDTKIFQRNLSSSSNFSLLLESVYSFSVLCANNEECLQQQSKLLRVLSIIYESKRCRDLYLNASVNTIRCIATLLSEPLCNNTKALSDIISIINVLCHKKKNCEIIATSKFFNALSSTLKLTKKLLTILSILKLMSQSEKALHCMASNENVVKILLGLLSYSGKKHLSKRSVISVLYRVTKIEQGLDIFKRQENYQCMLDWIITSKKSNSYQSRMTTIKAYTLLNRTINRIALDPKPITNFGSNNKTVDEDWSSEGSDGEDNSDNDSQGLIESETEGPLEAYPAVAFKALDYLPEMQLYFDEIFNTKSTSKLKIFENIDEINNNRASWKNIIERRIQRSKSNNKHSYPDCEILQEDLDNHYLNLKSNEINLEHLVHKFKCAKGMETNIFNPIIVYDLYRNCSKNCSAITLLFDSHFECGNLNMVIQTNEFEYDLIISPDTGSYRGLQWFYFQVSNIKSGFRYTFNIVNFLKVNSQYNYGMQPLLFSVTDYMLHGIGWKRVGENIIYYGNNYTNYNETRQYRTLSFAISFKYTNDCVYFAYHYPYTYTRLMTILYSICTTTSSNVYKRVDKLCNTVNNNEVPILTITAAPNKSKSVKIPITERPIIFITARVHPGETNASWIAEGMIKFLLNETSEEACRIREYFIFKIIPMLNIEGVISGNTRSGISGIDMNRCWANPNQNSCSEIYYTKKLIEYVKKGLKQKIAACIDIHGHSRKKYFFFYGCNPKMSWSQDDWQQGDCLDALKALPHFTSMLNPNLRLSFCRYRIERNRESTARVVLWREFGIQNSYTLECSYCSGSDNQTINTQMLSEIGANVIAALGMMQETCAKTSSLC